MVLVATGAGRAHADPEPARHRLSIEEDPLPYFLEGYDAVVAYQHPALPHVRVSLSAYSTHLPSPVLPDGFHAATTGGTIMLAYHRGAGGRGWMIGAQVAFAAEHYTSDAAPGRDSVDDLVGGVIAGYRWFPFGHGFFVYPWGRLAVSIPVRGDRAIVVGDRMMKTSWFSPFVTVHVGYELAF